MTQLKKLFGTDGVRGLVGTFPIEPASLVKMAFSIATFFAQQYPHEKLKCIIGKDTRISGYMIESALVSGLLSKNVDVVYLGPIPSPGVAMLVPSLKAHFGIMISASHNPYHDNGIKIFDPAGEKITSHQQEQIEHFFYSKEFLKTEEIGKASRLIDCTGRYIEFVKRTLPSSFSLSGMKIVLDCANGSGYKFAPRILEELGAEVITIANDPDGYNINEKCGATAPKQLSQAVIHYEADVGIALDGDADRVVIVDEKGREIKGEHLIATLATILGAKKCVVTCISNPALVQYLTSQNIEVFISDVGDREVLALMKQHEAPLGGEPSGHYILSQFLNSSDGMIAGLQALHFLKETHQKASTLSQLFPLMNSYEKKFILKDQNFTNDMINAYLCDTTLTSHYVVRKSGTEKALRLHMWHSEKNILEAEVEQANLLIEKFLSGREYSDL